MKALHDLFFITQLKILQHNEKVSLFTHLGSVNFTNFRTNYNDNIDIQVLHTYA